MNNKTINVLPKNKNYKTKYQSTKTFMFILIKNLGFFIKNTIQKN